VGSSAFAGRGMALLDDLVIALDDWDLAVFDYREATSSTQPRALPLQSTEVAAASAHIVVACEDRRPRISDPRKMKTTLLTAKMAAKHSVATPVSVALGSCAWVPTRAWTSGT